MHRKTATHSAVAALELARTKRMTLQELSLTPHALRPGALDLAAADSGYLTLIHVLPDGAQPFSGRDGRGPYTYDPQTILESFQAMGMDPPVDYEHQSVMPPSGYAGPIPAAGWYQAIAYFAGEGFYAAIKWTERAASLLAGQEYRYISPNVEFIPRRDNGDAGEIVALTGAGLTHHPNLYLAAFSRDAAARAGAGSNTGHPSTQPSAHMLEILKKLFGLPETATEADVQAAVEAAHAKATALAAVATELGATEATPEAVTTAAQSQKASHATALAAMTQRAETAETEVKTLKAASHAAKVDGAIAAAIKAGTMLKDSPAETHARALAALPDTALFDGYMATLTKPVVPLGERKPDAHAQNTGDLPALTASQKAVCKATGVTEEAFAKQLAAQKR